MEDAELLAAWRSGDKAAGEALFERHFATVARFLRNKTDEAAVADLLQQTFVALLEARATFRGEGSFRGYLLGVAYNVLRHHYRARKPDAQLDLEQTSIADVGLRPSEVVAIRNEQRVLLHALRRIPVEHQIVLELHYWESMTASAIGEVVGAPEGTVRTRLRRAKQLLEERLAELVEGPRLATTLARLDDWAQEIRANLVRA